VAAPKNAGKALILRVRGQSMVKVTVVAWGLEFRIRGYHVHQLENK
jgi:hypothetical protein